MLLFSIILIGRLIVDPTDILRPFWDSIIFVLPAWTKNFIIKKKKNKPNLNIHKKFIALLNRSLEKCIRQLNQRINDNKIEIDLQKFVNFQKESDFDFIGI